MRVAGYAHFERAQAEWGRIRVPVSLAAGQWFPGDGYNISRSRQQRNSWTRLNLFCYLLFPPLAVLRIPSYVRMCVYLGVCICICHTGQPIIVSHSSPFPCFHNVPRLLRSLASVDGGHSAGVRQRGHVIDAHMHMCHIILHSVVF